VGLDTTINYQILSFHAKNASNKHNFIEIESEEYLLHNYQLFIIIHLLLYIRFVVVLQKTSVITRKFDNEIALIPNN